MTLVSRYISKEMQAIKSLYEIDKAHVQGGIPLYRLFNNYSQRSYLVRARSFRSEACLVLSEFSINACFDSCKDNCGKNFAGHR